MTRLNRTVFDITIDFQKSHGSYLYDKKTNQYFLDVFSMFSSLPIGYNHEIFDDEFDNRIRHISHLKMCNNLFNSTELDSFCNYFSEITAQPHFHFASTGALAVESALKCAFEYKKNNNSLVVGTTNSFHGINSWGFITDKNISSVKNRVINYPRNNWKNINIEKIVNFINDNSKNIVACIIEPIQCTAGDIYLDVKLLKEIESVCKEKDICLIVDEVQTGMGVTGDYWYSDKINIEPDILVFGKKSQISGIAVNQKYSEAILSPYRKLEVTFDGDLIDACRGEYVLRAIKKFSLLENVNKNSKILRNELGDKFLNYRSEGHLIAFDLKNSQKRDLFVTKAYENNLLVNPTSDRSIRLRPNLAFSDNELDDFIDRIKKSLN